MPPANSRATSPPAAASPHPQQAEAEADQVSLSPVNQEVLNLARTLTTQAEEDAQAEWSADNARERLRRLDGQREDRLDSERRERLRRVMSRLSRIHDLPAYSDRTPSSNNLYDWSPSANEADDEYELDQILAELRQEQPNTHPEVLRVLGRSQLDSEREIRIRAYSSRLLNSNPPSQGASDRSLLQSVRRHPRFSARTRDSLRYGSDREGSSRTTVHRSDSRERMSPSRGMGSASPLDRHRYPSLESHRQAALQRYAERNTERERDRDMLARVDSYRRSYLDRTSSSPSVSPLLEQTIKYLSRLRYSNSEDDSYNYALDAGFLSKEYFCAENLDFVLDTFSIPPPAETSWLAPGAVLSGCQHATTVTSTVTSASATGPSTTLYRFRNNDTMSSTVFDPSRPWLSQSYSSPHRRSMTASGPEVVTSHNPQQDRWPVKVTIHAVDYERMSLAATMEAYNVPSHPHTIQNLLNAAAESSQPFTRTSSITTYLEGEILDFNTHTLLTESFKSNPVNDATYWRKLPPFQNFTDEELVRKLTSKQWLVEELGREWILMRWKERCFVKSLNNSTSSPPPSTDASFSSYAAQRHASASFNSTTSSRENYAPSYHWPASVGQAQDGGEGVFDDNGCGLTISGFYYVCLRRSDGKLEGLYYDPQSSPYQHLKLDSVMGGRFPAWSFR